MCMDCHERVGQWNYYVCMIFQIFILIYKYTINMLLSWESIMIFNGIKFNFSILSIFTEIYVPRELYEI